MIFWFAFNREPLKETGRRPLTFRRIGRWTRGWSFPAASARGFVFWQPIAWPEDAAPVGEHAARFHRDVVDYLSVCQTLEIRFKLPVTPAKSP